MRESAPVDPNLSLADMLPPDKADESRILQAAFALVAALARRTPSGKAEVTVTLDAEGWAALEAERRRYLRPHASYVYAPHPEGAGAVRLVRGISAEERAGLERAIEYAQRSRPPNADADMAASIGAQRVLRACGVRTFGGDVCTLPAGHQPGVDHGPNATGERP